MYPNVVHCGEPLAPRPSLAVECCSAAIILLPAARVLHRFRRTFRRPDGCSEHAPPASRRPNAARFVLIELERQQSRAAPASSRAARELGVSVRAEHARACVLRCSSGTAAIAIRATRHRAPHRRGTWPIDPPDRRTATLSPPQISRSISLRAHLSPRRGRIAPLASLAVLACTNCDRCAAITSSGASTDSGLPAPVRCT